MTWDEIRTLEAIRDGKQLNARQRELAMRLAEPIDVGDDDCFPTYVERDGERFQLTTFGEMALDNDRERTPTNYIRGDRA